MQADTSLGRWQWFYDQQGAAPFGYSESPAFEMGADWLADCDTIADWGCGGGLFSRHIPADRYIGVDGSQTGAVTVVADLATYREPSDGVFMRNVLEHNYDWATILDNALAAFRQRMALTVYTPWHDGPEPSSEILFEDAYGVPLLSFRRDALEARMAGVTYELHDVEAGSYYGLDHVYLISKP